MVFKAFKILWVGRREDARWRSARGKAMTPLAFAERILPRASDLWVQASLDYKQRLQVLFFPEGIAYDGNRFNRTAATRHFSTIWRRLKVLMKEW